MTVSGRGFSGCRAAHESGDEEEVPNKHPRGPRPGKQKGKAAAANIPAQEGAAVRALLAVAGSSSPAAAPAA